MSSAVVEAQEENEVVENKDPKFAHYADSTSVTEGYIMGTPVKAICGTMFVPSRDPKNFPICPICRELAEALFLDTGE